MKAEIRGVLLHVVLPVCVGACIYILFRKENLIVFSWIREVSLLETTLILRNLVAGWKEQIPSLVLYSLPDGIWVYSATYLMLVIWKNNWKRITALFWILTPVVLGIGSELLQSVKIINGFFCYYDMVFYMIGFILPLIMFRRNYENQEIIV